MRPASLAVAAILLLGAALRLTEIGDGVPYTIGVDEPEIVERAVRMMKTADFHPHFYDYPGFTFYFHTAVASVRFLAGAMAGKWATLGEVWTGDFYLCSRIATACLSILTIFIVYRIGLRWGAPVALIASLAVAVQPQLVREAHYALTDTPLTFFVALTLLASLAASGDPKPRWFFVAGLAAGLAASTKYTGVLALLMPLAAVPLAGPIRTGAANLLGILGGAALGFLAGAPYSLLDLPGFLNGFAGLMQHYNRDIAPGAGARVYFTHIQNWFSWPGVLPRIVAWPALLLCLIGVIALVRQLVASRTRAPALIVLAFPLVYYWFIAQQSLRYGRYAMPLVPFLCLSLALGLVATYGWLSARPRTNRFREIAAAMLLLVLLPPLLQSISANRALTLQSTQEQAALWMLQHIQTNEPVVVEGTVARLPPSKFKVGETLRLIMKTVDQYRKDGTVYLVASSGEYDKYFKAPDPSRFTGEIGAYNTIFRSTETVQVFTPTRQHPGPTVRILRIAR